MRRLSKGGNSSTLCSFWIAREAKKKVSSAIRRPLSSQVDGPNFVGLGKGEEKEERELPRASVINRSSGPIPPLERLMVWLAEAPLAPPLRP